MHEPDRVRRGDAVDQLQQQGRRCLRLVRPRQPGLQRLAVDEFHRQERAVVDDAGLDHRDDVPAVLQHRRLARFLEQSPAPIRVLRDLLRQQLQRHLHGAAFVERPVHDPHRPAPEFLEQPIVADASRGRSWCRGWRRVLHCIRREAGSRVQLLLERRAQFREAPGVADAELHQALAHPLRADRRGRPRRGSRFDEPALDGHLQQRATLARVPLHDVLVLSVRAAQGRGHQRIRCSAVRQAVRSESNDWRRLSATHGDLLGRLGQVSLAERG